MARNDTTSAIIDNILNLAVTGSALTASLVVPNLLVALDKPLDIFWKRMDKRSRERELRRVISYMKSNHLLESNYQHGLQITNKGRARLEKVHFNSLSIQPPRKWDKKWRLVIYDIPENRKDGRKALTAKITKLGFYQLQRSAWLYPFPCRNVVEMVASRYKVDRYLSYIETARIDNQKVIIKKFKKKYPKTFF